MELVGKKGGKHIIKKQIGPLITEVGWKLVGAPLIYSRWQKNKVTGNCTEKVFRKKELWVCKRYRVWKNPPMWCLGLGASKMRQYWCYLSDRNLEGRTELGRNQGVKFWKHWAWVGRSTNRICIWGPWALRWEAKKAEPLRNGQKRRQRRRKQMTSSYYSQDRILPNGVKEVKGGEDSRRMAV